MTEFTPVSALIGGALIGLSAVIFMALNGRVAGISGIIGGLISDRASQRSWRLSFLGGLVAAPLVVTLLGYDLGDITPPRDSVILVLAGLLVGFGTRMGSGCTSGHGICGMAQLSPRSIVATTIFLGVAIATLTLFNLVVGA